MKIACIIPARLNSTRFPNKVLALLGDKPMLKWVYDAAMLSGVFSEVVFAIDAKETADLLASFNAPYIYTDRSHQSGTDRLIEVALSQKISADIFVNWQADEPFINKAMIEDLLRFVEDDSDIWTLKKEITTEQESPHVVKVVTDEKGKALYFSRSRIPHSGQCYKHIGIYAYSKKALTKVSQMAPCALEKSEKLEQLRFLFHGLSIRVIETQNDTIGIDTPQDLILANDSIS